jgi:mannose-1-phosphate guanylyltransferase
MILAAGAGTRLRPHTDVLPKPMLPVRGRPTLEWIVLWLAHHSVRDIIINLHHHPEPVMAYFGTGERWGVKLTYSVEETLLGTAGGLKRVGHLFGDSFVVAYGDVLTDLDLGALMTFHEACPREPHVTLSLHEAENPWECGVVEMDADRRVVRFVEKPPREAVFSTLVSAGVLVMDPTILRHIPDGISDLGRDLLPALLRSGLAVYGQPIARDEYLLDMGTPHKYLRAQREWPTSTALACL